MTPGRRARLAAPATHSTAAHGVGGRRAARWSRSSIVTSVVAVVVGSTVGSALALRREPADSPRLPRTGESASSPRDDAPPGSPPAALGSAMPSGTPVAGPASAPAPSSSGPPAASAAAPPAPRPIDPRAALVAQIKDTLSRFVAWSRDHAGAPCPDAAALGAALDPWGQPLQIVCSDQPADQLAGILSFGPDRTPGTRDDVVSWTLGAEVADLVRGPRASRGTASTSKGARRAGEPARAAATGPMPAVAAPPPPPVAASPAPSPDRGEPVVPTSRTAPAARPPASPGAGSDDTDGDGIPDRR